MDHPQLEYRAVELSTKLCFSILLFFIAGHKDAAVNFAREAGLQMPVDVGLMDSRVKILEAAHEGRIDDCLKLLQESSPDLLERNTDVYLSVMVRSFHKILTSE